MTIGGMADGGVDKPGSRLEINTVWRKTIQVNLIVKLEGFKVLVLLFANSE